MDRMRKDLKERMVKGLGMIEIRFQGRGGQGVVVASEIFARACFEEGYYSQGYSIFGGERRGAPVAAFVRISDEKIYLKCDIEHPDHLVMFDSTLFSLAEIEAQLRPEGTLLFNIAGDLEPRFSGNYRVGLIDAQKISRNHGLGAIVNTAVLGAYARLSGIVSLDAVLKEIANTVPAAVEENLAAAREAYESIALRSWGDSE
jgi:2-oxoacid:acceptor oxidoreductase gamma subunit (pyruvate/2-ketoisovalerate family)